MDGWLLHREGKGAECLHDAVRCAAVCSADKAVDVREASTALITTLIEVGVCQCDSYVYRSTLLLPAVYTPASAARGSVSNHALLVQPARDARLQCLPGAAIPHGWYKYTRPSCDDPAGARSSRGGRSL